VLEVVGPRGGANGAEVATAEVRDDDGRACAVVEANGPEVRDVDDGRDSVAEGAAASKEDRPSRHAAQGDSTNGPTCMPPLP
jgi:hypothetical protein